MKTMLLSLMFVLLTSIFSSCGTSSSPLNMSVGYNTPSISSISPNQGLVASAVLVTISGSQFQPNSTINVVGAVNGTTGAITVSGTTVVNQAQMTAVFTVGSNAPLGNYNVTVTTAAGTSNVGLFAVNSPTLAITTTSLPSATAGVPYTYQLTATGGVAPYTWTVTAGSVPPGLSVSANGVLSGTPNAADAGLTYTFTVTVTDSAGTAKQAVSTRITATTSVR